MLNFNITLKDRHDFVCLINSFINTKNPKKYFPELIHYCLKIAEAQSAPLSSYIYVTWISCIQNFSTTCYYTDRRWTYAFHQTKY